MAACLPACLPDWIDRWLDSWEGGGYRWFNYVKGTDEASEVAFGDITSQPPDMLDPGIRLKLSDRL